MRRFGKAGVLLPALALAAAFFLLPNPPARGLPNLGDFVLVLEAPGMGDIIVDDFNSDGIDDLAVSGYATNAVYIFFMFPGERPPFPDVTITTPFPSKITSGDVTDDGTSDLIVLGENRVSIYEQKFPGLFELLTELDVGFARDIAVGDFEPDGLNDIFVTGYMGTTVFFQSQPPMRFHPLRSMSTPDAVGDGLSLARINDDDLVDLVVASPSHIATFLQTGPANYEIDSILSLDTNDYYPEYLSVGDINSDNRIDIIIPRPRYENSEYGNVRVFFSNSSYGFSASNSIDMVGDVSTLTLMDFDMDGSSEIVVSLTNGDIVATNQSLSFSLQTPPLITFNKPEGTRLLASGDFNGDSLVDIVARVTNLAFVFFAEDAPVDLVMPIPSTFHLNEGETRRDLIDLRQYFYDDYGILDFNLIFEEDISKLDATLNGHFMSFRASSGWSGSLQFRVEAWDRNPMNEPAKSNIFDVWVNDAPQIVSSAPANASVGSEYSYQIIVEDSYPEWDTITFKLLVGSEGMTIDEDGLLIWTPEDPGTRTVRIEVLDVFGLSDVQTFTIEVPSPPPPPPVLPPETPYVAGATAATLTAVATAVMISENIKWVLLLLFAPLYSKIRREKVLDHFIRGQIYGYILANPGEHYNAIKQALNLTNGSLAHHLKTLEREEFVKSRKQGLYRRFYPRHMRIPDDGGFRVNPVQRLIVNLIGQNPGISQKEIAKAINITPPTVNYHIGILASAKLIHVVRQGRKTECFVERS